MKFRAVCYLWFNTWGSGLRSMPLRFISWFCNQLILWTSTSHLSPGFNFLNLRERIKERRHDRMWTESENQKSWGFLVASSFLLLLLLLLFFVSLWRFCLCLGFFCGFFCGLFVLGLLFILSLLRVLRVFRFDFFQKALFLMQSTFKVNDVKNNNFKLSPVRNLWYILARKY